MANRNMANANGNENVKLGVLVGNELNADANRMLTGSTDSLDKSPDIIPQGNVPFYPLTEQQQHAIYCKFSIK